MSIATPTATAPIPPIAQLVPAVPAGPPPGTRRTYALQLRDASEGLERVLTELRRRRCRVTDLQYVAADRHRPTHLVVGVEAPSSHAHLVEAWLRGIVAVTAVERVRTAA